MTELWLLPPVLALLAGVLALAPLGIQVLQRGVVFMDLAVAQAAAVAALAALALGEHPHWAVTQAAAVFGALLATALVAALARVWPEHREALIGLVYVSCACVALLLARQDAHGAEHLHRLLAADVLWADGAQALLMAGCAAAVGCVGAARLSRDRWFYICFACAVSGAVQVLGLFIVFTALISPGLACRAGLRPWLAIVLAFIASVTGLGASWVFDAPSGPLVALGLALYGLVASLWAHRSNVRLPKPPSPPTGGPH